MKIYIYVCECILMYSYELCRLYRCTIFLHGVGHLVALVAAAFAGEKALLAHVKVEALEAAVSAQHTNANMGKWTEIYVI